MRSVNSPSKPYAKRPLAPANDPAVMSPEPPAKCRRTTPLPSEIEAAQTLSFLQNHVRDKILQQLAADPFHLDLSGYSTVDLLNLSPGSLGNAGLKVTHLQLPKGLPNLPSICDSMPKLQTLHLPEFMGDKLELQTFTQLKKIEGSASVRLEIVHADASTELHIDVSQRLRKVRVQRYAEGKIGRTHALPGHAYTHIRPGASEPDYTLLNGVARFPDNGELIVCRHIARHVHDSWQSTKGSGKSSASSYAGIATPADLETKVRGDTQERYTAEMGFSPLYSFVDDRGFGEFAEGQLAALEKIARARQLAKSCAAYYLASTNHVTSLLLKAKATVPPVYTATLVDPNALLAPRRIEANSLLSIRDEARGWHLTKLIPRNSLDAYTDPQQPALLYAFMPQLRSPDQRPMVVNYIKSEQLTHSEFFYSMLQLGLDETLSLALERLADLYESGEINGLQMYRALSASGMMKNSGLSVAITFGHVACVSHFTAALERLANTKTTKHLLDIGPNCLPDTWCDSLLTTDASWSDLINSPNTKVRDCVSIVVATCQRLFENKHLSAEACVKRIAQTGTGIYREWNTINSALASKDDALMLALQNLITALHKSGKVSREECATLVKDAELLDKWLPAPPPPDAAPSWFVVNPNTGLFMLAEEADLLQLGIDFQADSDFSINW